MILLATTATLKWQRSSDNGSSWSDIACTSFVYTESNPSAGHYTYRAQNGDGTYSPYVEVTYYEAVPATINITPLNGAIKTVDENITFVLEVEEDNYSYQWYKDNTAIEGATGNTYAISVVKSSHAGVYKCKVWNGCNEVYSGTSTLTVNKCPQVITFPEIPVKTYGDDAVTLPEKTDKGLTITYQSINTNVATVSGNILTLRNPGTSTIIASQGGDGDYLLASNVERLLTINKQTQTITFEAIPQKRYGGPAFTLPAVTDKGLTISYQIINPEVATVSGNTVTIHNSGTTDIKASQVGNDYYYAAIPVDQTLTVQKANQSITFAGFDAKTYGDPAIVLNQYSDANLEITYTSDNEASATVDGNTVTLHNAGTANITATQAGNSNYNPAAAITRALVIGKASQQIVWDHIEPKTYGDEDFTLPAATDRGLTITYAVANENVASVTGNRLHITGAGNTTVTATQAGNDNYFPATQVDQTLVVSKSLQTITFGELPVKTYGDAAFALQASVNSNRTLTFESSNPGVAAVSGSTLTIAGAGSAYITASVAGDNNYYAAAPVQRQLTVDKAAQEITLDIIPNKTYGDAAFALSAQVNTGLSVAYTSSDPGKLFISGNQATILGAGNITVTARQAGNGNYLPVSVSRTVAISKANLTISAENKERYYGDENPALTYTFSGFVNGDGRADLQRLPEIACAAEPASPAANYAIAISNAADGNYDILYQNAQLTVKPAPLTVKPKNAGRKYGEANPAFVLDFSGFKNNETETVLTERPVAVTGARTTSNAGVYDILVSGGEAANYSLAYETGLLTVGKAPLTVSVNDKRRFYGDNNPPLTATFTGFRNEDTPDDVDAMPVFSTTAVKTSDVGVYPIEAADAEDNNYEFTYQSAQLTVDKASLVVTADNAGREYGEENPSLSYTITGFKNTDTQEVIDVLPGISTLATKTSNAGTYAVTVRNATDNNYDFTYQNAQLTVGKAPLVVTADDKQRKQGESNPPFTLQYSGFKNGENQSVLDKLPSISCSANESSAIGFYDIVLSGGLDNNYAYDLVNGQLEVIRGTGVDEVSASKISVYPNPVKRDLFIQSDYPVKKVEIYSQSGVRLLIDESFTGKIDVSRLPDGIYFVKIYTGENVATRKIMKTKN